MKNNRDAMVLYRYRLRGAFGMWALTESTCAIGVWIVSGRIPCFFRSEAEDIFSLECYF
jgi:hypothetical protein